MNEWLLPILFLGLKKRTITVRSAPPNPLDSMTIDAQADSYWCWAAVALALIRHYTPQRVIDQCGTASLIKGQTCCCGAIPTYCQSPHPLQDAVRKVGHLSGRSQSSGSFWEVVLGEYEAGRPLACRMVGWVANDGTVISTHAVIVRGRLESGTRLFYRVLDPWGPSYADRELQFFEGKLKTHFLTALRGVKS